MQIRRIVVLAAGAVLACTAVSTVPADAATPSAGAAIHSPAVNLSRPLIRVNGKIAPASADGYKTLYSGNWSGYAALPKTSGQTFSSVVANYTVPSVDCTATPNTFSYHWIGLDGWSSATVEQDGIAADCNGTTAQYAAWYEMYPAPFFFNFVVHPGDAIESAVYHLANGKYELKLQDVSTGQGFDVSRACPVAVCEDSSAEAITEAYYYNKRYSGTSAFGDEHYANITVTDSAGNVGGLASSSWKTGEGIALGQFGAVDTTPGPLVTTYTGLVRTSAMTVFWSRMN